MLHTPARVMRLPGDPRAHCDGPRAVTKLTDWHKRRGREVAELMAKAEAAEQDAALNSMH